MNVEQQLLANQGEMMKTLGQLEKGQEIINGRIGKLEDWKDTRPQKCPVDERKKRTWPIVAGVSAITVALLKAIEFIVLGGK